MEREAMLERLPRMEAAKARTVRFSAYLYAGADGVLQLSQSVRAANAICYCGAWLVWRDYFLDGLQTDVRLAAAQYCRLYKCCGLCASLRSAKLANRAEENFTQLVKDTGESLIAHLVFTIRNAAEMMDVYQRIRDAFSRLVRRRADRLNGKNTSTEFAKVVGGMWSVELHRGSGSGLWHPHLHVAVVLSDYLDMGLLRAEWRELTDGEGLNLYCQEVGTGEEVLRDAVRECCKYVVKPGQLSFRDNAEVFGKTAGRRFMGTFGKLRGVEVDDNLSDELRRDGSPFADILLGWDGEGYAPLERREGEVTREGYEPTYRSYLASGGTLRVVRRAGSYRIEDDNEERELVPVVSRVVSADGLPFD